MTKRMTTAEARRSWARVVRSAQAGHPVEVTRNGEAIAAVVSVEQLRRIERETPYEVIARFRAGAQAKHLDGADPWSEVRDQSTGREIEIE